MTKIVYLLGAGASAGANFKVKDINKEYIKIPLANNFHKSINQYCIKNNENFTLLNDTAIERILWELKELSAFIQRYNTIDEAMRKLYLNREYDKFEKYKKLTSIVFYILECMHKHKDTRYEQFLLTLVENDYTLPDNVHILSWNYDNQFELAADNILDGESNRTSLKPNKNYYKINGTAYHSDFGKHWHDKTNKKTNTSEDYEPHKTYIHNLYNSQSNIEFAWEDPKYEKASMEAKLNDHLLSISAYNSRIILVTIGYSFSYVNSKYDGKIFDILNPYKIYVQDPHMNETDLQDLKDRFNLYQDNLIHISHANKFYLPPEMYVNQG